MAGPGTFTVFNDFLTQLAKAENVDLSTDTIKMGIIDATAPVPSATTALPAWGAGGTTDLSTNEVATGATNNYPLGGVDITATGTKWEYTAGPPPTWQLNASTVNITQADNNPSNAAYGIVYDDSSTPKYCIGIVEINTAGADLSAGNFSITWHADGLFKISKV